MCECVFVLSTVVECMCIMYVAVLLFLMTGIAMKGDEAAAKPKVWQAGRLGNTTTTTTNNNIKNNSNNYDKISDN
jgi:hypothetical protein